MGSCLCKNKASIEGDTNWARSDSNSTVQASGSIAKNHKTMDTVLIDQLIMEMLRIVGCFSETEDESPIPLIKLNNIAFKEDGWSQVAMSLVNTIPLDEPLGPSAISIIFDDIPLPPKATVINLVRSYNLSQERALAACSNVPLSERDTIIRRERNLCVLLGCIAEKYAGGISIEVLSQSTLDYLHTFLRERSEPCLVLFALVALEKFARTTENKETIIEYFTGQSFHPLLPLEKLVPDGNNWTKYLVKEVVFCATWALDNIFVVEGRPLSCETVDMTNINAMLNANKVSENLKISPDGLEARCDSHSFESARCTFQSDTDCWYYECEIYTGGVMQVGWATETSQFQNHEGFGVGDDKCSLAYDGCRRLIWYKAHPISVYYMPQWKPGDILGCLIDIPRREAIFSLNGQRLPICSEIFENTREAYHAAASFMAHQQCRFNFGRDNFIFPPQDRPFKAFNDYGILKGSERKIIPRRFVVEKLKNEPIVENVCVVCYDNRADSTIAPCRHSGFCGSCASQLHDCPICRKEVSEVLTCA